MISRKSVPHLPLLTFLGLSLGVLFAAWKFQDNDTRAGQQEAELVADQTARRLEEFMESRLKAVDVVRNAMLDGEIEGRSSFEAFAAGMLENFSGLQAINYVDRDGVIRWVTPKESNESAHGRDLFTNEFAGPVLAEAKETHETRLTPPLELYQGGLGVAAYLPMISEAGEVTGYINAVFRLEPVVATVLSSEIQEEYALWIRDGERDIHGNERAFLSGSKSEILATEVVHVLDRAWKLSFSPDIQAWGLARTSFHLTFLGLGLLLAAALAMGLHFYSERQLSRQRALEVRSELEGRLLQSQKMEAVGRLAGGVAHDFNNLLTAILGNADLLEAMNELDDDSRAALEQIRIAGDRATKLTTQLLTISRRQVIPSPAIDLNQELRTLDGVLRRLVRENIEFVEELADVPFIVELDPGRLSQIVINLVVNAVDAMPEGGRLVMRTEIREHTHEGRRGRWVTLTVEDTGAGMDEGTRMRALEPFFTTKDMAKGTGLGLATVDGIATSAGGLIHIETQRDVGTRVMVMFPASQKLPAEPPAPLPACWNGGVALVVEDEVSVLEISARILGEAGYEVQTATDGREALARVDAGLEFDLLVTDAVMPHLGGRSLLEGLRQRGLNCAAIITSGYPDQLSAQDLERLHASFLEKPFSAQTLRRAVQEANELQASVV